MPYPYYLNIYIYKSRDFKSIRSNLSWLMSTQNIRKAVNSIQTTKKVKLIYHYLPYSCLLVGSLLLCVIAYSSVHPFFFHPVLRFHPRLLIKLDQNPADIITRVILGTKILKKQHYVTRYRSCVMIFFGNMIRKQYY